MNNNQLKNKPVPDHYARCYNEQCKKADHCLRRVAALHTSADTSFISIINPACIPTGNTACPHFQSAEKVRMAWGISHLFDKVPYKDGTNIRGQLICYFGKTHYYRVYRQERPITPQAQAFIRQIFRSKDIKEEPVFDGYTDEYNW